MAVVPAHSSKDIFTTTGNGVLQTLKTALKSFGIQIKGTGAAPTSWTVVLEGSLDGVNFTTIISHSNTDGDGVVKWTGANLFPCTYYRTRCSAVSLGGATNIVASVVGR